MKKAHITKDKLQEVMAGIAALTSQEVYVGYPQEKNPPRSGGGGMNNATLAYIHNNGAPEVNLPARPFLVPGVQSAERAVVNKFKSMAKLIVTTSPKNIRSVLDSGFDAVGITAVNAVKRYIRTGPFEPLSTNTFRARDKKKIKKFKKMDFGDYFLQKEMQQRKPLIDTAQMLNAVTYVKRVQVSRALSIAGGEG